MPSGFSVPWTRDQERTGREAKRDQRTGRETGREKVGIEGRDTETERERQREVRECGRCEDDGRSGRGVTLG
jgi:ribosomal protein S14